VNVPNDPKLDYRDYRDDEPRPKQFAAELVGGVAAGVATVIVCGVTWRFANVYYRPHPTAAFQTSELDWAGPSVCTTISLAMLAFLGLLAHRTGRRGIWIGMLVGTGTMMLMEGACFYNAWR